MNGSGLGVLTWAAIVVVLAAAAVLSFDAVRDLAVLCGVRDELAPLLPIAIDGGVAVSTRVWLSGRAVIAERFARRMTLALLAVTVAANALHADLVAADVRPAWWVAVMVGAVPAFVVGSTCHLVALLIRRPAKGTPLPGTPAPDVTPVQDDHDEAGAAQRHVLPGAAENPDQDRAVALIAEGAGRRRLARELDMTEHQARELLAAHRNGDGRVTR